MDLSKKMENIKAEDIKKAFGELLDKYSNPAYGSMSKRDFDIELFMKLQSLGIIDKDPELYDIISLLKVTRAKARSLLYESKMRTSSEDGLSKELKELLAKPIFYKTGDKIAIEISNPLLSDHLRWKLKKLGHITDSSFSPELIKLTQDAYISICKEIMTEEVVTKIEGILQDDKSKNLNFKSFLQSILTNLAKKVLGDIGEKVVEELYEHLEELLLVEKKNVEEIPNIVTKILSKL